MRALIQRVREARVDVQASTAAAIGPGLLALCAFSAVDTETDSDWMARKIVHLRIFDDDRGVMNRSLLDAGGELLAVSQFTLYASTRKGARPSYSAAASPEFAAPCFRTLIRALEAELGRPVSTGIFGAAMQVSLVNDGPVTIWLDSVVRE